MTEAMLVDVRADIVGDRAGTEGVAELGAEELAAVLEDGDNATLGGTCTASFRPRLRPWAVAGGPT